MDNPQEYNSPKWNAAWENFLLNKALEKNITKTERRVFLIRFKRENWDNKIEDFCEQIGVALETFLKHQTKIFHAFEDECPELLENHHKFDVLKKYLLDIFNKSINLNPYEETQDKRCKHILKPGALIRIKAPSKMGKTQLLNNILACAREEKYQTMQINFLQIESSRFDSLDLFLRWFCTAIIDALELEIDLEKCWTENRCSKQNCTMFLKQILQKFDQPLVIGLDDVDHLLKYPDISQDFFYILRVWHEKANHKKLWRKLRLIVVYSTEDFGTLNINRSPFNVGYAKDIKPFDRKQIEEVSQDYQLNLSNSDIDQLINLLGGHRYLVDSIMSHLSSDSEISLAKLLEQASTDIGIYSTFLRDHLFNLRANDKLAQAFIEIIKSKMPIKIDALLAYQLYRMGLIKWANYGNAVVPFCELYRLYFLERLSLEASSR